MGTIALFGLLVIAAALCVVPAAAHTALLSQGYWKTRNAYGPASNDPWP
ncbi:hypothetical protein ASZ90_010271 [hydrocarbon metagenome]|uniref:Uncharacterized protein n=1 Tax=hydrocarbon metagenome TaxID=938273 RepID=A0A0W8FH77_9ZZZZ